MGDMHVKSIADLLPSWMAPPPAPSPAGAGEEFDCDMETPREEFRPVFPQAMTIGGVLHVVHNLTDRVHGAMPDASTFLDMLRPISALLHFKWSRDRFVSTCIRGGAFARFEFLFKRGVPKLLDWRWSVIVDTLEVLLSVHHVFVQAFDAAKFGYRTEDDVADAQRREDHAETRNEIDVKSIETTCRNRFFWVFAKMLFHLHVCAKEFSNWSETCPCHGGLHAMDDEEKKTFECLLRDLDLMGKDGLSFQCPLQGMRAPELAIGKWKEVFTRIYGLREGQLLEECVGLTPVERDRILHNFAAAKNKVFSELLLKLHHWDHLPWKLAGLAHYDIPMAREVAGQAITIFDASSSNRADHHRLSWILLSPGQVRLQLEKFRDGADLDDLEELAWVVCGFLFMLVCERAVEGSHSRLAKQAAYRRVSPLYMYLIWRLLEWEKSLLTNSELFHRTCGAFRRVRSRKSIPELFGFRNILA